MYKYLLLALLIVGTLQQSDANASPLSGTYQVTSNSRSGSSSLPSSNPPVAMSIAGTQSRIQAPQQPQNWNFLNEKTLGSDAGWVTPTSTGAVQPLGWLTTYTITFTTDCPQNDVILNVAGTGSLFIYINDKLIRSWLSPYPLIHRIILGSSDLVCGCNTIKVLVYNYYFASPAAMIYSLAQDQTRCYQCINSGDSYYNRKTCSCQCSFEANCKDSHPLQVWRDYPTCGCRCSIQAKCTSDFYWNSRTCSCQCKQKCCPQNHVLDTSSCQCVKKCLINANSCTGNTWFDEVKCQCVPKCLPFAPCPSGQQWSFRTCSCQCSQQKSCNSIQMWNPDTCNCDCLALPLCIGGYVFDPQTCGCKPGNSGVGAVSSLSSSVTINGNN